MVDFSKLVGKQAQVDVTDPLKLFESLDRKGSHTTLRPAQIEALAALHQRRAERDHVLKLGTGVGKSSVALLYLRPYMAETKRPGVYLCPTKQLVLQVINEASLLGVQAHEYPANERHPNASCMTGDAVLVCTYAKLFNGITTFDRPDVQITPCAIVLDDAHAGIDEVRKAFRFHLTADEIVQPLLQILDGAGRTYSLAIWEEILLGRPEPTVEIPYWLWISVVDQVRACLSTHVEHKEVAFAWPFLRENLRWCRCVVGAQGIEIVPNIIPTQLARAYDGAAHRLFMSGTLADEAVLVRELACSADAAAKPIVAGADAGLGERMVLAPTLLDVTLDRKWVMQFCESAAKQVRVVVLCASEKRAREWASYGATVVTKDAVIDVVDQLRTGELRFVALAQRYDGVDLPDDACRLLVLDGMPYGEGLVDRHDNQRHAGPRNRLVFRIEQGMGRAVRSPADYAVVVLAGPDLASFTSKVEVRGLMSADARTQLELAHELATLARQGGADPAASLVDMIRKCLNRDAGWKAFYDERVRKVVSPPVRRASDAAILLADAEQRAAERGRSGAGVEAARIITDAIATHVQTDEAVKAQYIQQKANYLYESNRGEAFEAQKQAYTKNRTMFRPPDGVVTRPPDPGHVKAGAAIIRWYGGFAHQNGAIAEFQTVRTKLSFEQSHNVFEQGLKELAVFLGAEGSRPEEEEGVGAPDNLLLWGDLSLVIEAKNEARYDLIPKRDAEQLLHSMEWFKNGYPTRVGRPVMVVQTSRAGDGVFMPEGSRILTPALLEKLLDAVDGFLVSLTSKAPSAWSEKEVAGLLTQHGLSAAQIVGTCTVGAS
jgi:hypothetical protein